MNFGARLPRARMPLVWACAVALVLTTSLIAVRTMLHREPPPSKDWLQSNNTRQLDELSRELGRLLYELSLAPEESAEEFAQWQSRVDRQLRPRVTEFHRRLLAHPARGEAYQALLHAADRLGAAAANPGDERLLAAAQSARETAQSLLRENSAYTLSH